MARFVRAALLCLAGGAVALLLGSSLIQWLPEGVQWFPEGVQWLPERTTPARPILSPGAEGRITVDVRNAGGVDGMARSATDFLRGEGFDVVAVGNAGSFGQQKSVVIDRVGNLEPATRVADVLAIDSVISEPDLNLFVDVTVRLGAEWMIPQEPEPVEPEPPGFMDRLREFFREIGGER